LIVKGEMKVLRRKKKGKKWWKILLGVIGVLLAVVIVYVAYLLISYSRIEDNQALEIKGKAASASVKTDTEYTAMTYNIGFGAYTPDFTFFMDGGKQSWANSKESVIDCIEGDISVLREHKVDFAMLQEVDTDATRSYHVDESQRFCDAFDDMSSAFAANFHSAFLFYPFYQPHGASDSGILTLSDVQITSSLRRSLPVSESIAKIVDLDRCYSVSRIPVENGKELVILNTHLSAYGTDGDLQQQQLEKLFGDMQQEYEKGNYVICAGDFNHDFLGNSKEVFNKEITEEHVWAAPFPDEMIPDHFGKVTDYASGVTTPSCRNCDKPYGDDCFTVTVDGFIVSDNVDATYTDVIDTQFAYSDHNPVEMKFKLKK
jgi:endonuclease/exonuclease/phosphatase family metal-dependent hydrolase